MWVSLILSMLLFVRLLFGYRVWYLMLRPLVYVGIVFVVYLSSTYQPEYLAGADWVTYIFFGFLVAGIGLSIRFSDQGKFNVTPMDYLVVLAVLVIAVLASSKVVDGTMTAIALKSIILFYGCELIFTRMQHRLNAFTVSMLAALLVIGVRGLIMNS
jgi:UDP-GlcNAc:undecaprenyl-phosphate GlcNAc-1-phosphate transferase